ncbi:hypothetical protein [Chishuiella sp.]|uniref:hypothetical protein n=1 Tax=Chishuiella sp. TaxID=1969467 RepID=UPI0028AA76D0|nr:hypothetical protein [Chishuiella sp.]
MKNNINTDTDIFNQELKEETFNKVKNLIDNVDIKDLKRYLNEFVVDSFNSDLVFDNKGLHRSFFSYFQLIEFLDHIQDVQSFEGEEMNRRRNEKFS